MEMIHDPSGSPGNCSRPRRRVHVEADDILDLLGELRIARAVKVRMRCGWRRCFAHRRCTARSEIPTAFAMARPVQRVTAPDGGEQVNSRCKSANVTMADRRRFSRCFSSAGDWISGKPLDEAISLPPVVRSNGNALI
jgi:hypothetical protein